MRALAHSVIPVVAVPLLSGAGFAAAISLGEFGATSMLSRSGGETLPIVIERLLLRTGGNFREASLWAVDHPRIGHNGNRGHSRHVIESKETMSSLHADQLRIARGGHPVITEASFDVPHGSTTVIVGPQEAENRHFFQQSQPYQCRWWHPATR